MILTLQRLKDLDACTEQLALFESTFGESVEVTPELCVSVADKFNFVWAARYLLSQSARTEYGRVRAPAWAEYERVTAPVLAEYERVLARTFGELYCRGEVE